MFSHQPKSEMKRFYHDNKENFKDESKMKCLENGFGSSSNSLGDELLIHNFKEFIKKGLNKDDNPKKSHHQHLATELTKPQKIDITQIGYVPETVPKKSDQTVLSDLITTVCMFLSQMSKERSELIQVAQPLQVSTPVCDYWGRISLFAGNPIILLLEIAKIIKEEAFQSTDCCKIKLI
jgi:hypothetical protein